MTPEEYVKNVELVLSALSDNTKAKQMSTYMKDQFEFLGIPTPLRREALKSLNHLAFNENQLFEIAESLWLKPEREYHYAAIDLLDRNSKHLSQLSVPRLLMLAQREPWWETVDSLAGVIGDVITRTRKTNLDAQLLMDDALSHSCLWVRRIAMTHQLGWRLNTDVVRLFKYAITLSSEKDFFIRKAIGWALRDYAKWNPTAVRAFLLNNKNHFSGLTIREATKHIKI
jgi:3-methyladenine DNA glycosylase AlkD